MAMLALGDLFLTDGRHVSLRTATYRQTDFRPSAVEHMLSHPQVVEAFLRELVLRRMNWTTNIMAGSTISNASQGE